MSEPFDGDLAGVGDEADAADVTDEISAFEHFDEGEAADAFADDQFTEDDDATFAEELGDAAAMEMSDNVDDMALWNVFEEELADGMDAADDDEFIGRLLGGLGRAAGVLSRGTGRAAGAAGQVGSFAQRAGRAAGQVGRAAGGISSTAMAAAQLARLLGSPGAANALGQVGRVAQGVSRGAGQARGLSRSLGQAAGGAQGLFAHLSQLLSQGSGADDAFDAVADLYLEDGVDEALPAAVGLAARSAARGLGLRNVAQLSLAARRALVRGVAAAARELGRTGGPQAVRALPRLARSAARTAQRQAPTPQRAVQLVRRGLPQAAQRLARDPGMVRRLARPSGPQPLARTTDIGRGIRSAGRGRERTFNISGPATLRITPR